MNRLTVIVALSLGLAAIPAVSQNKSGLQKLVEADLNRYPAYAGIYVKHLTTGEEVAYRADEAFNSASVIKIPVMVLAYQMADQKKLNLNERYEMKTADYRGGSGILRMHDPGQTPTIRDVITEMIITSDNSATDIMIAKTGGVARVNEWLNQSGYNGLKLVQTTNDLFRKRYELLGARYQKLTSEEVFALQIGHPYFTKGREALIKEVNEAAARQDIGGQFLKHMESETAYWLGSMTPRDTGRMLEAIEKGTAASKEACDEMKRAFRGQQAGARRLPHFLNVPVGHKTGDFGPALANDVGIIYSRSGPIVVSFFVHRNTGPYAETEDRMGMTARMIVDYFDGSLPR